MQRMQRLPGTTPVFAATRPHTYKNEATTVDDYWTTTITMRTPGTDMDSWNVTLFPHELEQVYNDHVTFQLVSHSPDDNHKDATFFKEWVFAAQGSSYIKVRPRHKGPLYHRLSEMEKVMVQSEYPTALIRGHQAVTVPELVQALREIECTAVRVCCYGMKARVPDAMFRIGNPRHPLAPYNSFDIGRRFDNVDIVLARPHEGSTGSKLFRILNPLSNDHGTVQMHFRLDGHPFIVKAYSPLVHCIKALAGNQVLHKPKNIKGLKARLNKFATYLERQRKLHDWSREEFGKSFLTGFRLEVTAQASTFGEAHALVDKYKLLDLETYTDYDNARMERHQLDFTYIRTQDYFEQCSSLYEKAINIGRLVQ